MIPLQLHIEAPFGYPKDFNRLGPVPAGEVEYSLNRIPFHLLQNTLKPVALRGRLSIMGGTFQDLLWEELRSDDVITAQDCNSLDTVFEFADVSRPGISAKEI